MKQEDKLFKNWQNGFDWGLFSAFMGIIVGFIIMSLEPWLLLVKIGLALIIYRFIFRQIFK